MRGFEDDFPSALGAALSSVMGRTFLFVLACVLGIVAATATAMHEFVWPWQVVWAVFPLFLGGLFLSWWTFLISCGLVAFLALFLARDIWLVFALVPFFVVWLLCHAVLASWGQF
jgi:hypothetical protein